MADGSRRRTTGAPAGVATVALAAAAGVAGAGLGAAFAVTALLRRSKPLHPVGVVASGRLVVEPTAVSGVPLLDAAGEYDCMVRASYAVGVGPRHADIEGFALRVLDGLPDVPMVDVLFASTGTGPVGRHVLTVVAPGRHDVQTTLLPVRAAGRALYLRLDPLDPRSQPWPTTFTLSFAHGSGEWRPFGTLTVRWGASVDAPERFDPIVHPIPGTSQYLPITALREPAYRLVRLAWPPTPRLRHRIRDR